MLWVFVASCTDGFRCGTGRRSSEYGADELSDGRKVCDAGLRLLKCSSHRHHTFPSSPRASWAYLTRWFCWALEPIFAQHAGETGMSDGGN